MLDMSLVEISLPALSRHCILTRFDYAAVFGFVLRSPPMPTLNIPLEKFTLDNWLTVILHRDVQSPLVTVDIWYHVGSKDEQPGRTGFAHLFEHLMFMGSQHAPSPSFDSIMENWC